MDKKLTFLATAVLLILVVAPVTNSFQAKPNELNSVEIKQVGIESFVKHDWTIATSTFTYTGAEYMPPDSQYMLKQIKEVFKSLELGKFVIVIGENYPDIEIAYITPFIILGNNLTVYAETIAMMLNISITEAQDLEFTIPKGSGIAPTLFSGIIQVSGPISPGPVSPLLEKTFLADGYKISQAPPSQPSMVPIVTSMPYNYSMMAIMPPAPLLNPAYLSTYATFWPYLINNTFPKGIYGYVEDLGTEYKFGITGSNTTTSGQMTQTTTIDFFAKYDKATGVLKHLYIEAIFEQSGGGMVMSINIKFLMGYNGYTDLQFNLVNGEKIGFTPTKIDFPDSFIGFLEFASGGTINSTIVNMIRDYILSTNITLEYNETLSFTGIDLVYNASIATWNGTNYTSIIASDLAFGSPYVLAIWDEMASVAQMEAFIATDLLGKILAYQAKQQPNITISLTGEYAVLVHGTPDNFDFISSYIKANFMFTNSSPYGVYVEGYVEQWFTYTPDGYLTEIGLIVNITNIIFDTDGDGQFSDEVLTFRFYLDVSINRVANAPLAQGYKVLGEPDFGSPINPPDPKPGASGWTDVTPAKKEQPPGVVPDTTAPTISDVTYYPTEPSKGDTVLVKAKVSDDSEVSQVILSYQNGTEWYNVTMSYNETSGYYEATFTMPTDGKINVTIYAGDVYGNWNTYTFEIGKEVAPGPTGIPQQYVYIAVGVVAIVVLVAIIALLNRRG